MDMDTDADADMTSHKGQRGRGGLLCVKLREGPRSVQCSSMDMDTDADADMTLHKAGLAVPCGTNPSHGSPCSTACCTCKCPVR